MPLLDPDLDCVASSHAPDGKVSPVSCAGNSVSTLFQSKQTRGEYIASRTAKLRPRPWTGLNRRPDAMQRKHRNGRPSSKMSLEHEIAHLRGLDHRQLNNPLKTL